MNLPSNTHMTRTKHEKASEAVRAQEQKDLATSTDAVKGTVPGVDLGANPGAAPNADPGTAQGADQETAKTRSACETVKLTRLTSKGG